MGSKMGKRIMALVLTGVMCTGVLAASATPAYAGTKIKPVVVQSDWSARDKRDSEMRREEARHEREKREIQERYEREKEIRRREEREREARERYERAKAERENYERIHRKHRPDYEEDKSGSRKTKSQGDVNTAAIVGAVLGAVIAKNT